MNKDWKIIQLDSGHYMAVHGDDVRSSPIFALKSWCINWVKEYIKREIK